MPTAKTRIPPRSINCGNYGHGLLDVLVKLLLLATLLPSAWAEVAESCSRTNIGSVGAFCADAVNGPCMPRGILGTCFFFDFAAGLGYDSSADGDEAVRMPRRPGCGLSEGWRCSQTTDVFQRGTAVGAYMGAAVMRATTAVGCDNAAVDSPDVHDKRRRARPPDLASWQAHRGRANGNGHERTADYDGRTAGVAVAPVRALGRGTRLAVSFLVGNFGKYRCAPHVAHMSVGAFAEWIAGADMYRYRVWPTLYLLLILPPLLFIGGYLGYRTRRRAFLGSDHMQTGCRETVLHRGTSRWRGRICVWVGGRRNARGVRRIARACAATARHCSPDGRRSNEGWGQFALPIGWHWHLLPRRTHRLRRGRMRGRRRRTEADCAPRAPRACGRWMPEETSALAAADHPDGWLLRACPVWQAQRACIAASPRCEVGAGRAAGNRRGRPRSRFLCGNTLHRAVALACIWKEVARIGEARHPGPQSLPHAKAGSGAVCYPRPLRPGFRDVRCSGYDGGVPGEPPMRDKYQLSVITVNATSWKAAVRFLERTRADVVLVQETRVMNKDIARHSARAFRRGWQTLWTPAVKGPKGFPSGGAAICARAPVALSRPTCGPSEVIPGRVVAGMIEPPACRPTMAYAGYLRDGVGADTENLGYLASIGAHKRMQQQGVQAIIGCDFNFPPETLAETGFHDEVGGVIVRPGGGQTTCRTRTSARVLDYFVVTKPLAKGIEGVNAVEATGVKTHLPVQLSFYPRLTSLKALALRKPPNLGVERMCGPRLPPPSWKAIAGELEELIKAARKGGRKAVEQDYQRLLERWADLAEVELQQVTGETTAKAQLRGRRPRLYWRSVLPEKVQPRTSDSVVALRAIANALMDLQRLTDGRERESEGPRGRGSQFGSAARVRENLATISRDHPAHAATQLCQCALGIFDDYDLEAGSGGIDSQRHARGSDQAPGESSSENMGIGTRGAVKRDDTGTEGGDTYEGLHGDQLDMEDDPFDNLDLDDDSGFDGDPTDGVTTHEPQPDVVNEEAEESAECSPQREAWRDIDPATHWSLRLGQLVKIVAKAERDEERAELRKAVKEWHGWIRSNALKGMKNAHLYSKVPTAWVPSTTLKDGDMVTADPMNLLDGYLDQFGGIWDAEADDGGDGIPLVDCTTENDCDPPPLEPLPRLEPDELRAVSATFSLGTACTFDGFRMRHFALLTDECLRALAAIFAVAEITGSFPRQLRVLPVPLLPKPKGGHRPIGIFTSPYRLWAKARRCLAQRWEDEHERGYWASGKGRSAQDAVWRQAAKAEVSAAGGRHAATLLWDGVSFFDSVDHGKLEARARKAGFPLQLLRPALAMYKAPRLVSMGGFVARELVPRRGVVAGCGFATALIKAYCLDPFDDFISGNGNGGRRGHGGNAGDDHARCGDRHCCDSSGCSGGSAGRGGRPGEGLGTPGHAHRGPGCEVNGGGATTDFDAYIDDFGLTVQADTETAVVETMVEAQARLREIIGTDLNAEISLAKAGLVANSESLAERLRTRIGIAAGQKVSSIANLGIDHSAGKKREHRHTGGARKKRLLGAFARRCRVAALAQALTRRQLKGIYTAGVALAADYGATVNGLADDEVRRLRQVAATAFTPRGKGRSLTMTLLLNGMPTWISELAPALQYARAVWRASAGGARQQDLSLADFARLWRELEDCGYIKGLIKRRGGGDGTHRSADADVRRWAASRGPIGAMILSLHRVGWRVRDPFNWEDDRGCEVSLITNSPALLKVLLQEATQREAQRKVARTWTEEGDPSFGETRVCTDVVAAELNSCRHLTRLERGALASTVADAV